MTSSLFDQNKITVNLTELPEVERLHAILGLVEQLRLDVISNTHRYLTSNGGEALLDSLFKYGACGVYNTVTVQKLQIIHELKCWAEQAIDSYEDLCRLEIEAQRND